MKEKDQKPEEEEIEQEAAECGSVSPSNIYTRYDVIQDREDIVPSRLRDMRKKRKKK